MKIPRRKIEVVAYNKNWPIEFESEASRLRKVITGGFLKIHHIGSTAVPGLAAKPVIDILFEVTDLSFLDRLKSKIESLGYLSKGEFGIPGRRFYLKGLIERTHHIHAFESGSSGLLRHLAMRDFLRKSPERAAEYGALKEKNAKAFPFDNDGYCEAKHEFVQDLEQESLRWADQAQ